MCAVLARKANTRQSAHPRKVRGACGVDVTTSVPRRQKLWCAGQKGLQIRMEPQLNERSEHLGNFGQEQCDCEQFRSCLCQSLAGKHTFLLSASRGPMQCSGQGHPQNPVSISALQVRHVQRLCSWLWPTCAPKCKPPGVRRLQGWAWWEITPHLASPP